MTDHQQHPASFRDPAGFIFQHQGTYYRQVNQAFAPHYELFKKSGLYDLLVGQQKLISHTELPDNLTGSQNWYTTLLPEQLRFVSYPYEWCFSQWKDAALLTLDLVKTGIDHGMILKDATPFNVQFINGAPVFIDSLSFEQYNASKPWVAYRQFIECFIGPMLLARYHSPEMLRVFQIYPDGIPLHLLSKMLPFKSLWNLNVLMHVRLPQWVSSPQKTSAPREATFTREKLIHIISNLHSFVQSLQLPPMVTEWKNYYDETILSKDYAAARMKILESWLSSMNAKTALDIGTNTGLYAKATAAAGIFTIATDADSACIDVLYNDCRKNNISQLLPLCADITNPTPAIGWRNAERTSFLQRAGVDLVLALAVIHHLAIGKNTSFEQMAACFSSLADNLVIEFVPKTDPKTQLLLQDREDIFHHYTQSSFEAVFGEKYDIADKVIVPGTERTMYRMKRK